MLWSTTTSSKSARSLAMIDSSNGTILAPRSLVATTAAHDGGAR